MARSDDDDRSVLRVYSDDDHIVVLAYQLVPHCPPILTESEHEVITALMRGASNAEIGRERGTSLNTVSNQISAVYTKLGVNSRAELAAKLHQLCVQCTAHEPRCGACDAEQL